MVMDEMPMHVRGKAGRGNTGMGGGDSGSAGFQSKYNTRPFASKAGMWHNDDSDRWLSLQTFQLCEHVRQRLLKGRGKPYHILNYIVFSCMDVFPPNYSTQ